MGLEPARRWLIPYYVSTVMIQVIVFVLRPTAVYRAIELDVPAVWLGALGASFAVVPLLLAVLSGQATDRFGERRVMLTGAVLTVVASAAFWQLAGNVWWLLAACVCLGTGHLCTVVGQQALVANRTPPTRYDTAFGHYGFAASAGQTVGPLVIWVFADDRAVPETAAIFGWSTAASLVVLASAMLVPRPRRSGTPPARRTGSVRRLVRRPGLVRALTISSVVLAAVDITLVYLPVLGTERDISAGTVGVLLAVRAATSMISRFFLGPLAARLGRQRLLTGSIAIAAASTALVALPAPMWVLILAIAILGLGLGCGQPLTMSWLAESAPPGLRGRVLSLRLTGNRLGQVLIPSLVGTLAAAAGAAGVLWVTTLGLTAVGVASRGVLRAGGPSTGPQA